MAKKTYSAPFLHYQIQHLITTKGEYEAFRHTPFIPMGENGLTLIGLDVGKVISIVYNLYLYDEHAIFIESFAHEFSPAAMVDNYLLSADLVDRSIADIFPRVDNLSDSAAALTVWQFAD